MPAPQRFGAVTDDDDPEDGNHDQAQHEMRAHQAEVDRDDDGGDRKAIADDRKCPGVAGVALEDEAARRARREVRPAGKQRARRRSAGSVCAARGRAPF